MRFILPALASTLFIACQTAEKERSLELRFVQDAELIAATPYGSPPQIAVWLEDPTDGSTHTLLVTKDSGAGTWRGKTESPEALPRWYEVYRREWGREGYPMPDAPVPDAVTRPTSTVETFTWTAELPAGDHWVCWIEVNLSGDYNERRLHPLSARQQSSFARSFFGSLGMTLLSPPKKPSLGLSSPTSRLRTFRSLCRFYRHVVSVTFVTFNL